MSQEWDGSKWVNRLGATEPRPTTEPETPTGDLPDDEAAPNGEATETEPIADIEAAMDAEAEAKSVIELHPGTPLA